MWEVLLVIAVIFFIVAVLGYWRHSDMSKVPEWVWALFIFSVLLAMVAFIAASYEPSKHTGDHHHTDTHTDTHAGIQHIDSHEDYYSY